jgi:hypothetical protein
VFEFFEGSYCLGFVGTEGGVVAGCEGSLQPQNDRQIMPSKQANLNFVMRSNYNISGSVYTVKSLEEVTHSQSAAFIIAVLRTPRIKYGLGESLRFMITQ